MGKPNFKFLDILSSYTEPLRDLSIIMKVSIKTIGPQLKLVKDAV
jgi:hypothetical protein